MQVARYWRMKKQTYRLEGVQDKNGHNSLIARPMSVENVAHHQPGAIREVASQPPRKVAAA